ncbi:MAG: hypothetical protein ACOY0T_35430 [Myxococcota bacterium]
MRSSRGCVSNAADGKDDTMAEVVAETGAVAVAVDVDVGATGAEAKVDEGGKTAEEQDGSEGTVRTGQDVRWEKWSMRGPLESAPSLCSEEEPNTMTSVR